MNIEELENMLLTKDGKSVKIPIGGSLGLLALGDVGLIAWRLKKNQLSKGAEKKEENEK